MELREIYENLGGNYDSVMCRLHDENKVIKYLLRFMDYHYDELIQNALDEGDYEVAFREAHNLKGLCANLNLDAFEVSASELTEALRGKTIEGDITALVKAMKQDYDRTALALSVLK